MKTVIFYFFLTVGLVMVVYEKGIMEGVTYAGKKSFRTVTGMLLEQKSLST
jgi:hypothetical protein